VYKAVIVLDPSNVAAMSNYAAILSDHRDDFEGAECAFQMALSMNPNDDTALANYATLVLGKRHEPRRAQELYLHALRHDPSNVATLYNYAVTLEDHVGDFRGASRFLRASLHIDPTSRETRERLATLERRCAQERARKKMDCAVQTGARKGTVNHAGRRQVENWVEEAVQVGVELERKLSGRLSY